MIFNLQTFLYIASLFIFVFGIFNGTSRDIVTLKNSAIKASAIVIIALVIVAIV